MGKFLRKTLFFCALGAPIYAAPDKQFMAVAVDQFAQSLSELARIRPTMREGKWTEEEWKKELENLEGGKKIHLLPTNLKLSRDQELKIDLPMFGQVVLKPVIDAKGYVTAFQSIKPASENPFIWGPLVIDQGLFKMADGKLSYVAWGTLFDRKIRIGLKDFSLNKKEESASDINVNDAAKAVEQKKPIEFYRLVVGITFEEGSFTFELAPGRTIVFKELNLVMEQGKGISLEHEGELFGTPVTVKATLDSTTRELNFSADIVQRPLVAILPDFKNSLLDGLLFSGSLKYTPKTGVIIKGDLKTDLTNTVDIAGIVLEKAHIDIDMTKGHAIISGSTYILGLPLLGYFGLFFGTEKGVKFAVDVPSKVKDWKPFSDSDIEALRTIVIHEIKASSYVQYNAIGKEKTTIKELVPLKTPQDILKNSEPLILGTEKGVTLTFFIAGKSTILNTKNELVLKLSKKPGSGFAVTFIAALPEGWKLSQSFPEVFKPRPSDGLQPDPFWKIICDGIDTFKIDRARIVATTTSEIIEDVSVEKGLNILGDVTIDAGADNTFIKMLAHNGIIKEGSQGASLGLRGNVDPTNPRGSFLIIDISTGGFGIDIGPSRFDSGALGLVLRGIPTIGLAGMFRVKPGPEEKPLQFYLDFNFSPYAAGISGSMKNTWKDPFGIKGFEFGDLGVAASQSYTSFNVEALATAGISLLIPATFGFTGKVKLGQGECYTSEKPKAGAVCAQGAINLGKDITQFALAADVTMPLPFATLLNILFSTMGTPPEFYEMMHKLVPVTIQRGSVKFVPAGTNIGGIIVRQGVGASLYLELFGKEAHVDASIGLDGITAKGKIPAFEFGPLLMTNADSTCDLKTGGFKNPKPEQKDATCGPTIDIQANPQNIHFIIDGLMKFGDLFQSRTKWHLSPDGIHFETETSFGVADAKFGLRLKGSSIPFNDPAKLLSLEPKDLFFEIEFKDDLTTKIREDISSELVRHKTIFESFINSEIERLSRETLLNDVIRQEGIVNKAADERVYFFSNPGLSISREAAYRFELLKLEAIKIKYELERTFVGKFLASVGQALGIDKLAKNVLMAVRTVGFGAAQTAELFFKDISRLVTVKRVYWKGSLADLGQGVIPGITLQLCAGCENIEAKTPPFDLRVDPLISIKTIASTSFDVIKRAVAATFADKKECDKGCGVPV